MFSRIRQHLGWKIFISYLFVILVGIFILAASVKFAIPSAFDRHMVAMIPMMGDSGMGMMGAGNSHEGDLYINFSNAVNEALMVAAFAAFITALVVSWFVSRQVVIPVREIMAASQHIAEGHYNERVDIPGDLNDADELAQLALSFNRMAERLYQTESMRRQLIGDVSHELRTPLTTIKGSMEGLIDGVLLPTPETFQGIHQEADRLQRLVADLQELSRIESGVVPLNLNSLDLSHTITAIAHHLHRQFDEKSVTLRLDIPPKLPLVKADKDRILQVLTNLVGNALQYTPSGGQVIIKGRETSAKAHHQLDTGNWVLVIVQDNGIGIPVEHIQNLFARFYRVDKSRSRVGGGSGVGLTIAKHLIEAHGGRIWAASSGAGEGSLFAFALPVIS